MVRAVSMAHRDMGSDLNRSTSPVDMSVTRATGMKVTSASVSGFRLIRAMLRLVSTHTSVT